MVGLVAERHRDDVELFEIGRHHVGGQLAAQRLRNLVDGQVSALLEGVVGHDLDDARIGLEGRDCGLRDLRQVEQHRLDFVQFDAVAADLHLRVDAAAILDLAVLIDAAEIAGAVDASRGIVLDVEKITDELLEGQFVAIHVADRKADARDTDLAKLARRKRPLLGRIEDDDRIGRERNADSDRLVRLQLGECRRDGCFGRTIGIQDAATGAVPARHEILRAGLAADQQDAQFRQIALDGRKQRRAARHDGDVVLAQKVSEFVADQRETRARRHQRRTGHQRHPDFLDREVEGNRHALVDAVARLIAVRLRRHAHEIADTRVRDGNALRISRRAGCVDDVAERIVSRGNAGHRTGWLGVDRALCLVEKNLPDFERCEALLEARHRNNGADFGVADDVAKAFGGKRGVERHISGVDLHHRQHRHISFGRLVEQQADAIAGHDALIDQMTGHLIGAAIEIPISEHRAIGDDGGTLGETGAAFLKQVIEPLALLPPHGVVGVLARHHFGRTKTQCDRFDDAAQRTRELLGRAQRHDRCAGGAMAAQAADVGRLIHWLAPALLAFSERKGEPAECCLHRAPSPKPRDSREAMNRE